MPLPISLSVAGPRCAIRTGPTGRPARRPCVGYCSGIDGDALEAAIGGWLTSRADASRTDQAPYAPSRRVRAAVAVDGKSLRGAVRVDGCCVHLLSALRGDGIVLAQHEVDAKSNEITAFRPLLDPLVLTGSVVTFDALLTQTDHARFLVEEKGAHYSAILKGNHSTLHALVKGSLLEGGAADGPHPGRHPRPR
ncbi:ISAs1 family transposase [Streptomyces sp. R28]|uniref:ISAs1 family transposase n=1 Tax=Streptomyces sp. R28 TaxID=3238628 RepID=A0AB39QAT4_9ACTN